MARREEPPLALPRRLLVQLDDDEIAWVSRYTEVDGPAQVDLDFMAVARRHRGQGGAVAQEMCTTTLMAIEDRAIEHKVAEVLVSATVWHENRPSQRMCASVGLEHVGWTEAPGVQIWQATLDIDPSAIEGTTAY